MVHDTLESSDSKSVNASHSSIKNTKTSNNGRAKIENFTPILKSAKKLNKSPENYQKYVSPEKTSRKRTSLEELVMQSNSQVSPVKSLVPPKRLRIADFYIYKGELIPKNEVYDGEKIFQVIL